MIARSAMPRSYHANFTVRPDLAQQSVDKGDQLNVDRGESKTPYKLKLDYEDVSTCPLHSRCRCRILPVR
ncbi:hypothetical protein [Nocardioides sp. AX2bis]|uniref:hypothetical protein n=1 Tax=Nocardioides sp. AX2bis TaxID=2653157 RepID=UPI00135834CE|nr:hypothetical protein [Nocardioides sp. AX2bis]